MHYLKKMIKWLIMLAFPAYFFLTFRPVDLQSELSLYVHNGVDTTFNMYVITQDDSTKSYTVQERFVIKPSKEEAFYLEGRGINDTLYLLAEYRGKSTVYEFIVDTAIENELIIAESTEVEFWGPELHKAVRSYKDEFAKNVFLIILYMWLIFIVIYIRSRK